VRAPSHNTARNKQEEQTAAALRLAATDSQLAAAEWHLPFLLLGKYLHPHVVGKVQHVAGIKSKCPAA